MTEGRRTSSKPPTQGEAVGDVGLGLANEVHVDNGTHREATELDVVARADAENEVHGALPLLVDDLEPRPDAERQWGQPIPGARFAEQGEGADCRTGRV